MPEDRPDRAGGRLAARRERFPIDASNPGPIVVRWVSRSARGVARCEGRCSGRSSPGTRLPARRAGGLPSAGPGSRRGDCRRRSYPKAAPGSRATPIASRLRERRAYGGRIAGVKRMRSASSKPTTALARDSPRSSARPASADRSRASYPSPSSACARHRAAAPAAPPGCRHQAPSGRGRSCSARSLSPAQPPQRRHSPRHAPSSPLQALRGRTMPHAEHRGPVHRGITANAGATRAAASQRRQPGRSTTGSRKPCAGPLRRSRCWW